jgi:hypothetical protein
LQAAGLEDEALIERVREAFDHPLVQELVDRFEGLAVRYENLQDEYRYKECDCEG